MTKRCRSTMKALSPDASGLLFAAVSISWLVMMLIAVLAGVLGAWRYCADLGWTTSFFIADGMLSRYQVWFACSIAAQTAAFTLNRWMTYQNLDPPGHPRSTD